MVLVIIFKVVLAVAPWNVFVILSIVLSYKMSLRILILYKYIFLIWKILGDFFSRFLPSQGWLALVHISFNVMDIYGAFLVVCRVTPFENLLSCFMILFGEAFFMSVNLCDCEAFLTIDLEVFSRFYIVTFYYILRRSSHT